MRVPSLLPFMLITLSLDRFFFWVSLQAGQLLYGKHSFSQLFITVLTPYRSSYLITIVFMTITATVLAEICSALPVSGSIYIWAAESAGPKYARFVGFVVAWWSCTAWMTFTAGNCQVRKFLLTHYLINC